MKLNLSCREVSRLVSDGLDERLNAPDRARIRLHFVMCSTCRNVNEQLGFIRRAMRHLNEHGDDPPGR